MVDVSQGWLAYLNAYYKQTANIPEENIEYNLSKYFTIQDHQFAMGVDGLTKYWTWDNLYDYAVPLPHTRKIANKWIEQGHDVVFVSMALGNHFESKKLFLEKYFKGASFVVTSRKDLIPCDVFIDDRNNFLNMADARYKFKVKTPYTQEVELTSEVVVVNNFDEISKYLK